MTSAPKAVRLADYRAPDWLVPSVHLDFALDPEATIVTARLEIARNPDAPGPDCPPLVLDGEDLELEDIRLDGGKLLEAEYILDGNRLVIPTPPARDFRLETQVRINPQDNTALSGLYRTGGNYCTQCEAQGFRRITFWPDRPDVLSRFTVRMEAKAADNPVLLSNGNCLEDGTLPGGRHYAIWEDPFPKPSYLFALVAGDLEKLEDAFTTMEGRNVTLRIWVQKGKRERARWAMESLKAAMRWDEERFGRTYDLDVFNIVAVPDFNMGAMENKSLNIFNDKYILASPEAATDDGYEAIEAIIGHEYFHNWTGNRITCRDWFQLCLKEGLTVFRDQEFTCDLRSRAVKRIADVRNLRARQFPEDAGPLAHPVRPDAYAAIDNFYTATVYEKGAEVVRMLHTLLGEEAFMGAMRLYFERFDGTAATVEDFITCMEEASGRDLAQFMRWYTQAGTPQVTVLKSHDAKSGRLTLVVSQSIPPTPGQPQKAPHHIPLRIAALDGQGREIPLRLAGGKPLENGLLELREARQTFVFEDVAADPVLSLNRGFGAPIALHAERSMAELMFLMAHDGDPFARWEAGQAAARRLILAAMENKTAPVRDYGAALEAIIKELRQRDPAFLAQMLHLPSVNALAADVRRDADPQAIHAARNQVLGRIGRQLAALLEETFHALAVTTPYAPAPRQTGRRAARGALLALLTHGGKRHGAALAFRTYGEAQNLSERTLAMKALMLTASKEREEALEDFIGRFGNDHLLVNTWLGWQAAWPNVRAIARVRELMDSRWFALTNPNRVRALVGVFAASNPVAFNAASGEGYALVAGVIERLDGLNPQVAARLASAFRSWRTLEPVRRGKAQAALERILAREGLSADTRDIVTRMLG